jgi:hypothetical protein
MDVPLCPAIDAAVGAGGARILGNEPKGDLWAGGEIAKDLVNRLMPSWWHSWHHFGVVMMPK